MTNLPASEEAFEKSREMATDTLGQVLRPNGAINLQAMGAIVLTAVMFGRNLLHLHRPGPHDNEDDINGGFWDRHREIEQILLQTSLELPDHLRLPCSLSSPNVVFANMCIHTSTICLHQAAIFKADKYQLPVSVSNESKIRCITAAAEIASIMRMISHLDLGAVGWILQEMSRELIVLDEPFHVFLCIRCSTRVCSILEDQTKRYANDFFASIPSSSYACATPQESSHWVFPGSIRPRLGKCGYAKSAAKGARATDDEGMCFLLQCSLNSTH